MPDSNSQVAGALFPGAKTPSGLAGPSGGSESAIEAFYLLQLLPWFYLQPGVEWIGTPGGGEPAPLRSAVQFYLLISLEF